MSDIMMTTADAANVTVVCSNYNSSRWAEGYCISLNKQLLKCFNIVVVDANSTDDSLNIIKSFRFREGISLKIIECTERISVYQAWNRAVENASTDYCINVNTDDRLYPAALLTLLSYAQAEPDVDVFYSPCFITLDPEHNNIANIFNWPEYSHDVLRAQCICGPFPLLKRAAIIAAGMFSERYRYSGDHEMWLRLSQNGYRFRKIPEVLGSYFYNPQGLSTDVSTKAQRIRENEEIQELYGKS